MKNISKVSKISKVRSPLLVLAFLLGLGSVGCEYYTDPQEITSNRESMESKKTIVSGESESIKNLESKINDLQGQLANKGQTDKGDTEVKALQEQIAQLQEALTNLKNNPPMVAKEPSFPGGRTGGPMRATFDDSHLDGSKALGEKEAGESPNEVPGTPGATPETPGIPEKICNPSMYTDGRKAVPLVITGYEHITFGGSKVRFVMDTSYVALNDRISSITIHKGPNYVEGDKVEFFEDGDFKGKSASFGPVSIPDFTGEQNLVKREGENVVEAVGTNDNISSLRIVRASDVASKKCADVKGDDPLAWKRKIHLITEIYQHGTFSGMFEQITNDVASLTNWGKNDESFNNTISSLKLFKGPDYNEGDYVQLFEDIDGSGEGPMGVHPDQFYEDPAPGTISYMGKDPWDFNDTVSSIYFYDKDDKRIYNEPEVE